MSSLPPEEEQGEVLLSFAMRGLATKLGTAPDEPLPWPMQEIIDDLDTYARSLERFVSDSDTVRGLAETWEQEFLDSLCPSERAELEAFEQQAAEALRAAGPEEIIVEENFVTADGRQRNSVDLDLSASVLRTARFAGATASPVVEISVIDCPTSSTHSGSNLPWNSRKSTSASLS